MKCFKGEFWGFFCAREQEEKESKGCPQQLGTFGHLDMAVEASAWCCPGSPPANLEPKNLLWAKPASLSCKK